MSDMRLTNLMGSLSLLNASEKRKAERDITNKARAEKRETNKSYRQAKSSAATDQLQERLMVEKGMRKAEREAYDLAKEAERAARKTVSALRKKGGKKTKKRSKKGTKKSKKSGNKRGKKSTRRT